MKRTLAEFARVTGGVLHGDDAEFGNVTLDTRKLAAADLFLAMPGEHVDGHDYVAAAHAAAAAGAVVTRLMPVPVPQIVVGDVAAALTLAAREWRAQFSIPLIGVAGSNGKTTVKEMLAAILSRAGECLSTSGNFNNHLGVPLTLLRLRPAHRSAVIEIGANHAGEVAALAALARPTIGLITNAGAEHLEGFGSLEGVARAEGEMMQALTPQCMAIINADDQFAALWRGMTRGRVLSFGLSPGANVRGTNVSFDVDERGFVARFKLESRGGNVNIELALGGRHNVQNALCAAAAALAAGATLTQIVEGLAEMRAVAGRLQFRRTAQGSWLIDDSYNANPSSTAAAIDVLAQLPGRKWMVLGDMAELGDHGEASHRDIGVLARERGIERLYTHGALAALAAVSFRSGAAAGRHSEAFSDHDSLLAVLQAQLNPEVRLLVKGSRVNRLERVVAALGAAPTMRRGG
jgi:UDP-N-acetylmuramoyl-tripeptide--D-alanyl-D-alanine ligase